MTEDLFSSRIRVNSVKKRFILPAVTFAAVFLFHAFWLMNAAIQASRQWVQTENMYKMSLFLYFKQLNFFTGFSYALAGSFTVYALVRYIENRGCGIAPAAGGITLTGLLYAGGCFITGCCGSPMLAVYLGLLGPYFLGVTKPLIALITALSVVLGFLWMDRKSKKCCSQELR